MVTKVRLTDSNRIDSYRYDFRALEIVSSGLRELLNHVTSLKPLLHLKSSLVSLMTEVDSIFLGILLSKK